MEEDVLFAHSLVSSMSVTVLSEVGDKTFFIAAILAMRHSRFSVFLGSFCGEGLMSIFSALLGYTAVFAPDWVTRIICSVLFIFFGLQMFREAYKADINEVKEELEEAEAEVQKRNEMEKKWTVDEFHCGSLRHSLKNLVHSFFSHAFLEAFTMTFFAEWGDRSQIATIFLAARDSVSGVITGGLIGHALCTVLAVFCGRVLADWISLKTVYIVGGCTFLICAVYI